MENAELVARYVKSSLEENIPMTFYNWECPPRYIDRDKSGNAFVNYRVDLTRIAKGEKLDYYTEIPRTIERADEEKKTLAYLADGRLNFRFVKVIADTNAFYITPESVAYVGKERITQAHQDFKQLIADKVSRYPVPTQVCLCTELIKPFQATYDKAYEEALSLLDSDKNRLVTEQTYKAQLARTRDHVGLSERRQVKIFTDRTIATYAAEGVAFDQLSQTNDFPNCVWLNIEEADQRTVDITNSLRRNKGMGNLPMVFPRMS